MARISWDYSRTPHQIRISYEAAICSFETAGPFAFRTFLLSRCPFGEELFCRSVLHYLDAFAPSTPAMCFILWVDTRGTVSFFAFYFPNNPGVYFFRNTGGPKSVASAKSNYLDRRRTASASLSQPTRETVRLPGQDGPWWCSECTSWKPDRNRGSECRSTCSIVKLHGTCSVCQRRD